MDFTGNSENIFAAIKYQLILRKITQKSIAQELNISESAVSLLINGKSKSQRFAKWIKENLNINI